MSASLEERGEFGFEGGELAASFANFGEFVFEECFDVAAWCGAVVADSDDACDFCEGESGGL